MPLVYRWIWSILPGNPVFLRVIQNGSGQRRDFWLRTGYLGILTLLVLMGMVVKGIAGEQTISRLASAGAEIFEFVSYSQVLLVCLIAPLFMAGTISSEQSVRTYDILLTTPLSSLQIVLGTLMGRLLCVWALLASGLPLFSIFLIFGGVPIGSVFVSFAVAALTALVVGSVAVTLAVLRIGGRRAVFMFVVCVAAWLVAIYLLDISLREHGGIRVAQNTTTWLTPLNPFLVFEASLNKESYRLATPEDIAAFPQPFRAYLASPLATYAVLSIVPSFLMIVGSTILLRLVHQDGPSPLAHWLLDGRMGPLLKRLGMGRWFGRLAGERRREPREVWLNPIAWREANTRGSALTGSTARGVFILVGVAIPVIQLALYHLGRLTPEAMIQTLELLLMVELTIISLVAVYMSASSISREREDGTLDLLLTTPITPRLYLWGKLRGLVGFLTSLIAAPVITIGIASVYSLIGPKIGLADGIVPVNGDVPAHPLVLPEAPLLLLMILLPYAALCVVVGLNHSLKAKGVIGAVASTIAFIGIFLLITGVCGAPTSGLHKIPFIGTAISAFSPTNGILILLQPWALIESFAKDQTLARIELGSSILLMTLVDGLIIYTLFKGLVANFDLTVRKLSGTAGG